jgi:hypothetical protein
MPAIIVGLLLRLTFVIDGAVDIQTKSDWAGMRFAVAPPSAVDQLAAVPQSELAWPVQKSVQVGVL